MEKDTCILEILNTGANAEGVGKLNNGKTCFVPYTLAQEKIEAFVYSEKKDFANAKCKNILKKSKFRTAPKCPYYEACGGCQLQHTTYQNALKIKQDIVQNALTRIGKLDVNVLSCTPSDLEFGYRNKISMPFNLKTKKLGLYKHNSHTIIDVDDCIITGTWCKKLIEITNQFVRKNNISIFDPRLNKGVLKHLVARSCGGTLLVTLVINSDQTAVFEDYYISLLTEFESVGLSVIINKTPKNVLPIGKYVHLFGKENSTLTEFGVEYSVNNTYFTQINNSVKNLIYESILQECQNHQLCVNCYSGAGLLTAMLAKKCDTVLGIEIDKNATTQANILCKNNNILNVKNYCAPCEVKLLELENKLKNKNTLIVLDPPRSGADKKVLNSILKTKPQTIMYISCNPATLARDLKILCDNNSYSISFARPYDMFPQTKHVETLVKLIKN